MASIPAIMSSRALLMKRSVMVFSCRGSFVLTCRNFTSGLIVVPCMKTVVQITYERCK